MQPGGIDFPVLSQQIRHDQQKQQQTSQLDPVMCGARARPFADVGIPQKLLDANRNLSFYWDSFRSEDHTSELQSRGHLVCRLLLEKKKKKRLFIKVLICK